MQRGQDFVRLVGSIRLSARELGNPQHRGAGGIFDFDPTLGSAGTIREIAALADNALKAQFASVLENDLAVTVEMFVVTNARLGFSQKALQRGLAYFQRLTAQVVAVQLQQIERVQENRIIVSLRMQLLEIRHAVGAARHRLAVQCHGLGAQRRYGFDNLWIFDRPIMAATREQSHQVPHRSER